MAAADDRGGSLESETKRRPSLKSDKNRRASLEEETNRRASLESEISRRASLGSETNWKASQESWTARRASLGSTSSRRTSVASEPNPEDNLSAEWLAIAEQLRSDDEEKIRAALKHTKARSTDVELDSDLTKVLMPLCIQQLDHPIFDIRALALNIVASQLHCENWALEHLVGDLALKLSQQRLLDVKSGESSENYMEFQKDLMYIIGDIHTRHPSKLVPVFKPIAIYLIEATDSSNREIAAMACLFWGNLKEPPVSEKLLEQWEAPFYLNLNKLVSALLKCMVYHPDYLQYMNSLTISGGKRPKTRSVAMQKHSDIRNYAALGFEKLCRIFTSTITPFFKPCISKWLNSEDWMEQEAIVLAIGAFCQAMDSSDSLKELIPDILHQLLKLLHSEHPMLRSITCFTIVNFMNDPVSEVDDPFGCMLKGTLSLISDDNCEVQEQALRSTATFMTCSQTDLRPFTKTTVEALQKVNSLAYDKSRYAYFECIGQTISRLGQTLNDKDFESLVAPLLDGWTSLLWNRELQGTEEEILPLCSSLSVVAKCAGERFAKHNKLLIDRIAKFLNQSLKESLKDPESDILTSHLVSYLDLLSALYEGQGDKLNEVIDQNKIPALMFHLVAKSEEFRDEVTLSCLALVGHICKHNYSHVRPILDSLLSTLFTQIQYRSPMIRGNALWTIAQICKNCHDKPDKLVDYHTKLIELFTDLDAAEPIVVHSATAFLYLVGHRQKQLLKVLFKADIFRHLCVLLQTPFEQEPQKLLLFHLLTGLVVANMPKVPKEEWIHFMAAAALLETDDDPLKLILKDILHKVKGVVGTTLWGKITGNLDQALMVKLRKKYTIN